MLSRETVGLRGGKDAELLRQRSDKTPGPPPSDAWTRFPRLVPMVVVAAFVGLLVVVTVAERPQLSKIDEIGHIDYLVRGSRGELVRQDDRMTQEAMRAAACRGSDGGLYPPCSSESFTAEAFAWNGYSPAASHSPYYYLLTGLVARVPSLLPGSPDIVTWGRLLGALWFLLGSYLTLRVGEVLRLRRWPVVVALIAVAGAPAVLHASARVNPDATAFAGGAAVLLAVLLCEARRVTRLMVAVAAFACTSLDPTNALAVILALAYLGVRLVDAPPNERRHRLRASGGIALAAVAGALVAILAWQFAASFLGAVDQAQNPQELAHHVDSLPIAKVLGSGPLFSLFPPLWNGFWPTSPTVAVDSFLYGTVYLVIASLLALASGVGRRASLPAVAMATTVALIAGGPLFVLRNYVLGSWWYPISPRYGLSVLVGVVVSLAWLAHRRVGLGMVVVAGGGLYVSALVQFV